MVSTPAPSPTARLIGANVAALFLISLFTGLYAGAAMTGKIPVDGHTALAAHLVCMMSVFLLASLGWTLPMLSYKESTKRLLALVFIASAYANWTVTTVKAALGVQGIDPGGSAANMAVFGILQVVVVIPGILGGAFWLWGFRRRGGEASGA